MKAPRALMIGAAILAVVGAGGVVVAAGPQDAAPAPARSADPIGDLLRNAPPVEGAPAGIPATSAPVAVPPPVVLPPTDDTVEEVVEAEAVETAEVKPEEKIVEPDVPVRRQRQRVAIIEAIDKITAQSMRFEVAVGGRPVRFNDNLIFSVRSCEVSAPNELVEDAVAYVDISLQPRGVNKTTEPRQIFRGWMFASTPAVNGLQHPIYDAWVVGCKA